MLVGLVLQLFPTPAATPGDTRLGSFEIINGEIMTTLLTAGARTPPRNRPLPGRRRNSSLAGAALSLAGAACNRLGFRS